MKLGIIDEPLVLLYNSIAVVISLTHILLPQMFLSMQSVMAEIDGNLTLAAEGMGAKPVTNFRTVFLPLSVPGIVSGCMMVFVLALGFYIAPALLGGSQDMMVSNLIQQNMDNMNWHIAAALSVELFVIVMAFVTVAYKFVGDQLFILVFIIVLPAIIVIPQAFTSLNYFTYPIPEFVTKWIDKFWENSEWVVGLTRSLVIAVIVAVVATVLGTLAAVAMQKLEFKGKGLFMGLMISPMVIPVVIIGVALYSTFSKVGLTNTFTGLILTHTLLALPMVFVTMSSGLGGVNPNLELAAMIMGCSPAKAFIQVVLPVVKPSLISSVLFSFVTSLDEVAASLFISGADTKTLPLGF